MTKGHNHASRSEWKRDLPETAGESQNVLDRTKVGVTEGADTINRWMPLAGPNTGGLPP